MKTALGLARSYGIAIRFADLGEWGRDELHAEYDPSVPEIRLNIRVAERLDARALGEFVDLAVGHELYHHRERIGEIAAIADRNVRETAADDFAHALRRHWE
jgi:hypothetical protein